MIRSLMASTALLALVTTGALAQQQPADQTQQPQAQQQPADQQMQTQQPGATSDVVRQTQEPGEVLADDLIGQTVYSGRTEDAESIGDISDLVLDQEGSVTAVIVGIGGFLGIGQRNVALNYEELEFTQDENGEMMIVVAATREELEAAPEFEQTDETRLYGGLSEDERSTARMPERDQAAQDQQAMGQPDQQAAGQPDQQPLGQVAQQPAETGQPQDRMAQDQTAQQPGATQDRMAQQPQEQAAQQPDQQMAAGGSETRFLTASETGDTRASDWIGKSVVTAEDEEIGEVQDLLVEDSGRTEAVLVDVGGFLETEKQVAIPFDSIQVEQQDGEEIRLVANMSREELEQAPAYQSDDAVAGQGQQPQDRMAQQPQDQTAPQPQDQAAQQGEQVDLQEAEQASRDSQQPQDQAAQQPRDQQQDQMAQQGQQGQQLEGTQQQLGAGEILADDLIGQTVYSGQGEDAEAIGDISDLVVDEQGEISAAVIGVGGFLGIGEQNVAVEFERLQFTQDQNGDVRIVADMTREQLEQAQAFEDNDQTQLYGELSDEQRSTARMPERGAEGDRQQMTAGEQQPSATGGAQERQAARAPGLEPQASGLSADDLMGANVIGVNDEEIGQVGDVLFSQDGQVRAIIVDVGGFLGIGAKEVAIEFESAQIQRQDGELALMVNATQEQLEQAPEWQQTAELQQQGGADQPQGQQPPAAQPPADQQPADQQQQPAQQ